MTVRRRRKYGEGDPRFGRAGSYDILAIAVLRSAIAFSPFSMTARTSAFVQAARERYHSRRTRYIISLRVTPHSTIGWS